MKLLQKIILGAFGFIFSTVAYGQLPNDKDVVTLKNGEQYVGYVFEQIPGLSIKMVRLIAQDTLTIPMSEVAKYSKLFATEYAIRRDIRKQNAASDTTKKHLAKTFILKLGLHVRGYYSVMNMQRSGYDLFQGMDSRSRAIIGGGLSLYKEVNSRIWLGVSYNLNESKYWKYHNTDAEDASVFFHKNAWMIDGKYSVFSTEKSSRLSVFIGAGVGYVLSRTYRWDYAQLGIENGDYSFTYQNSVSFESSLQFLIKPFKNGGSGLVIEPVYTYYNPTINIRDNKPKNQNGEHQFSTLHSSFKGKHHLLSVRIGYLF